MKIELTKPEAQTVIDALDLYTRNGGLNSAQKALPIAERIHMGVQPGPPQNGREEPAKTEPAAPRA